MACLEIHTSMAWFGWTSLRYVAQGFFQHYGAGVERFSNGCLVWAGDLKATTTVILLVTRCAAMCQWAVHETQP